MIHFDHKFHQLTSIMLLLRMLTSIPVLVNTVLLDHYAFEALPRLKLPLVFSRRSIIGAFRLPHQEKRVFDTLWYLTASTMAHQGKEKLLI